MAQTSRPLKASGHRKQVDQYFESSAAYWRDVYLKDRLLAAIYRARHAATLRWVDQLGLSRGARVLDVGCGAGFTSTALAERGYTVYAMDLNRTMLQTTLQTASANRPPRLVIPMIGDAHDLPFRSGSFDLVIALGVIPWLHSESEAFAEIARTLVPNGHLIISADNKLRLNWLIDPRMTPLLSSLRQRLKRLISLLGLRNAQPGQSIARVHHPREVDRFAATAGLRKVSCSSVGFGPFSFLGATLLSDSAGVWLHEILQRNANRGFPGLASTGSHYLLLTQKP